MWEYLVINESIGRGLGESYKSPESELNKLGEQDWELVEAVNIFLAGDHEVMFIFKRKKQE